MVGKIRLRDALKRAIPWWGKILAKLALSRLPIAYRRFAMLGVFRHGRMDDLDYARQVFTTHYERSEFSNKAGGFVALELGPGDSIVSAIIARAHGASRCYLVDDGDFSIRDVGFYRRVTSETLGAESATSWCSVEELLAQIGGSYLTQGIESLRTLPDGSVDFTWSQAVLEHIRLDEFDNTLRELRRVLTPQGVSSHRIDLRDHLGASLNNLRFSRKVWESDWMAKSGFYTNRIRYGDMLARFRSAGFDVQVLQVSRWKCLPIPRRRLSDEFQSVSEDELCVSGFDVLLRKDVTIAHQGWALSEFERPKVASCSRNCS